MEALERQVIILHLIDDMRKKGSWCGETHIQKAIFFLQALANKTLGFDFILYKHGPYSFELSDELTAMRAYGFLDWDLPSPNYGPRLKVTPFGSETLKKVYEKICDGFQPAIDFIADKLANYGVATLERLATALYFRASKKIVDKHACAEQIHSVKPHISPELASEATEDLDKMVREWQSSHR